MYKAKQKKSKKIVIFFRFFTDFFYLKTESLFLKHFFKKYMRF